MFKSKKAHPKDKLMLRLIALVLILLFFIHFFTDIDLLSPYSFFIN